MSLFNDRRWHIGPRVIYSVDDVDLGKPFPDLFLHAAACFGCPPTSALVIEDSIGGVTAAVAAGMPVTGLLAGSHLAPDHDVKLREAGATAIATSYDEISAWMARD